MGAYVALNRQRAAKALQQQFHQTAALETDPIVELIGCLLEDGAGGVLPPEQMPITTDEWLIWNQLALQQPNELVQTLTEVLETERSEIPVEPKALRSWAAALLLSTLDRMQMT
jgi:hypothetical protein